MTPEEQKEFALKHGFSEIGWHNNRLFQDYYVVLKKLPELWDYKKSKLHTASVIAVLGNDLIRARTIRTLILLNIEKGIVEKPIKT